MPVLGVVGGRAALLAVHLEPGSARLALAAGVDVGADADTVADGELRHLRAGLGDHAGDLVSGDHGVEAGAPAVGGLQEIGVAYAGVLDVDADVGAAYITAGDRQGLQFGAGGRGGIGRSGSGHDAFLRSASRNRGRSGMRRRRGFTRQGSRGRQVGQPAVSGCRTALIAVPSSTSAMAWWMSWRE